MYVRPEVKLGCFPYFRNWLSVGGQRHWPPRTLPNMWTTTAEKPTAIFTITWLLELLFEGAGRHSLMEAGGVSRIRNMDTYTYLAIEHSCYWERDSRARHTDQIWVRSGIAVSQSVTQSICDAKIHRLTDRWNEVKKKTPQKNEHNFSERSVPLLTIDGKVNIIRLRFWPVMV